jgi:hypothetical protein
MVVTLDIKLEPQPAAEIADRSPGLCGIRRRPMTHVECPGDQLIGHHIPELENRRGRCEGSDPQRVEEIRYCSNCKVQPSRLPARVRIGRAAGSSRVIRLSEPGGDIDNREDSECEEQGCLHGTIRCSHPHRRATWMEFLVATLGDRALVILTERLSL